jgi:hypothetical protein
MERIDLQEWFADLERENLLTSGPVDERAAMARRDAASIVFEKERQQLGTLDEVLLAVTSGILAEHFEEVNALARERALFPPDPTADWGGILRYTVLMGWMKLLSQTDRFMEVRDALAPLVALQATHEAIFLDKAEDRRAAAWELAALYFLFSALRKADEGAGLDFVQKQLDGAARSCLWAGAINLHSLVCRISVAFGVMRGCGRLPQS